MKSRGLKAVNSGRAIRQARKACGFTQDQLGVRLKLKGGPQAVYRWERASSAPTARSARELVRVLAEINAQVAEELGVRLALARGETPAPTPGPSADQTPTVSAIWDPGKGDAITQPIAAASGVVGQPAVGGPLRAPAAVREQPPPSDQFTVEYLVLRLADELELPARRVRMPLLQLLRSVQESGLALGTVMQELAKWIESANARAPASLDRAQ